MEAALIANATLNLCRYRYLIHIANLLEEVCMAIPEAGQIGACPEAGCNCNCPLFVNFCSI